MSNQCDHCPECDGKIEWAYCREDYGEPESCPLCKATIRAQRSDEEDSNGNMRYRYEWWTVEKPEVPYD